MDRILRQTIALSRKNAIVLRKQWKLNLLRCIILPLIFAGFISQAPTIFHPPTNFGLGSPTPVASLSDAFTTGKLLIHTSPQARDSNYPTTQDVISLLTQDFTPEQLSRTRQVDSIDSLESLCPPNFQLLSECFAVIVFNSPVSQPRVNYTIRTDLGGLMLVDVVNHSNHIESRLFPLQWAIDSAIIKLSSNSSQNLPKPIQWPYTKQGGEMAGLDLRASFLRGIRDITALALMAGFLGVVYHMSGDVIAERAEGMTSLLGAMGCSPISRLLSWFICISAAHLPSWIGIAILWSRFVFTAAHPGLIFTISLLTGLSLASWSLVACYVFARARLLTALGTSTIAVVMGIFGLIYNGGTPLAVILVLVFPPSFFILSIRSLSRWELLNERADPWQGDRAGINLSALIMAAMVNVIVYPCMSLLIEAWLYETNWPWKDPMSEATQVYTKDTDNDSVVSVNNLTIIYQHKPTLLSSLKSYFSSKNQDAQNLRHVTAVTNLSIKLQHHGIHVLCGTNGSGKSSILRTICQLQNPTTGTISFKLGTPERTPTPGRLGVVPQQNVLWRELSPRQHLSVWDQIQNAHSQKQVRDRTEISSLLSQFELISRSDIPAERLSGGEMRKLHLAIALIGDPRLLVLDEVSSAVDPLSRRTLWKMILAFRENRTIICASHFLDEADLIADQVIFLAPPGLLLSQGPPGHLKAEHVEEHGYMLHYRLSPNRLLIQSESTMSQNVLKAVQNLIPSAWPSEHAIVVKPSHPKQLAMLLQTLALEKDNLGIASYELRGATLEDVFLKTVNQEMKLIESKIDIPAPSKTNDTVLPPAKYPPYQSAGLPRQARQKAPFTCFLRPPVAIFLKRFSMFKRNWSSAAIAVTIVIGGACLPAAFFLGARPPHCRFTSPAEVRWPLFINQSPFGASPFASLFQAPLMDPPNALSGLNIRHSNVSESSSLEDTIVNRRASYSIGGASLHFPETKFLWEASLGNPAGPTLLNLVSNYVSVALNASDGITPHITPEFAPLPSTLERNIGSGIKWIAFFGISMSVYPVVSTLYVTRERSAGVKAMQLSNGFSPAALWAGHLLWELPTIVTISSLLIIVYATLGAQFVNLGYLWLVLVLYGIAGTLLSFLGSLWVQSPIISFTLVSMYQAAIFCAYLAAHLYTMTHSFNFYDPPKILSNLFFIFGIFSPNVSAIRSALLSANTFWDFCDDTSKLNPNYAPGALRKFGGPILYLVVTSLVYFSALVLHDSGVFQRLSIRSARSSPTDDEENLLIASGRGLTSDVTREAHRVKGSEDALRVLGISKAYRSAKALDNVSFGVNQEILALVGGNGAGKTTLFNAIRGNIQTEGNILVNGVDMRTRRMEACARLGVCPQVNALDPNLTVREHLLLYGRCHGLVGEDLESSLRGVMELTKLTELGDRYADRLSGGNQRKLCLAIALVGNPSVLLIDEWSTCVDPATKREVWDALRQATVGKTVLMTTHSLEEVTALASRVAILSRGRLLGIGTQDELISRYPIWELQVSCQTEEQRVSAQEIVRTQLPAWRALNDVAMRFEYKMEGPRLKSVDPTKRNEAVPENVTTDLTSLTLSSARLHGQVAQAFENSGIAYTLEKINLEGVFLRAVGQDVVENM